MNILRSPVFQYFTITVLYILLTLLLPANKAAMDIYHLTSAQYHVLVFMVTIPFVAVWYTAFYGYTRLKQYATTIQASSEGNDFKSLSRGIGWLAWALVIPAVLALILSTIGGNNSGFYDASIVITNYIYLYLPLVAYILLANSAQNLTNHVKLRLFNLSSKSLILVFVMLGVIFCYFTFRQLGSSSLSAANNAYYLPVWLVLITIVIPYLFSWFVGLLAAYEILLYSRHTRGLLYRHALQFLGSGIAVVIASSIAFQYITSITPRTSHLSLNVTLATVYLIQLLSAAGYILIAIGASRLKRIEEV